MDQSKRLRETTNVFNREQKTRPLSLTRVLGRDWKMALPFVLPIVVIMGVLIVYPFINAIQLSMTTRSMITRTDVFVGLDNYTRLFQDTDFVSALRNTLVFTVVSVALKFVLGLSIALLLHSELPLRNVLTGLILLPWIVPEVVTALTWRSIYDPLFGGLNPILQAIGLIDRPIAWLAEPGLAMPSVIVVNVWKGIPFYVILLLAGLKSIDQSQYEAAEVDGANVIQRFRNITMPGLRYVVMTTLLLSFISTFNTFGLIYIMTGGGPGGATRMFSILAYEKAIIGLRFGPGVATALSVAPFMALLIFVLARLMRPDDQMEVREKPSLMDRFGDVSERVIGWGLDLFLLPLQALLTLFGRFVQLFQPVDPDRAPRLKRSQRELIGVGLRLLLLIPVFIFVLFPFYWILITSFKTDLQIQRFTDIFVPNPWTIEQYRTLIADTPFVIWFRNTVIVATTSTALSVFVAALAAYALARLRFTGSGLLTTLLLIAYLLPASLLFIPLYGILTQLGVINTYSSLMLTYPTFLMPFATWVMMGYFRSIPVELEEAALIDGAKRFGAFWHVTLPLAAPALLSVTLFAFTNAWNEFLYAFVFINSDSLKTLPVGLQLLVFGDIYPWGQLMAASLLMAIPVVVVYIFAQRFLVGGLTAGSIKG